MHNLFFAIFGGILLSIILVVSAAWAALSELNNSRYLGYLEQTTSLTRELVQRGIERQPSENTEKWLKLVSSLMGIDLYQQPPQSQQQPKSRLLNIQTTNSAAPLIHLSVSEISEQLVSSTAFLTLNELGHLPVEQRQQALVELQQYAQYRISRVPRSELNLTAKQLLRLNRGETVIVRNVELGGLDSISSYSPWGKTNDVLMLGPIPYFEKYPWQMIVVASLLSLGLIAGVVWFFLMQLRNKVIQIQQTVDALGGENDSQLAVDKKDTIGQLKQKIESMASRINSLLDEKTQMVRAISHDLRTPIAKVHFRLERLAKLSPKNAYLVMSCKQDLNKLDLLIDELLSMEELNNSGTEDRVQCDLTKIIQQELNDTALQYKDVDIELDLSDAEHGLIWGYKSQIERLFANLITNAAKYTKNIIRVYIGKQDTKLIIIIKDNGNGIEDELLEKIFLPFFKADSARNHNVEGYGLGLSICKQIVTNHQGEISAENLSEGGLSITLELPILGSQCHQVEVSS